MVESLLFERPLPAVVALLLIAAVVAWTGHSRGRPALLRTAAVVVLLAGAWGAAGALVTTDREAVSRRSRELVAAVAAVRTSDVAAILDRDATLTYFRAPAGLDREAILREVERTLGGEYRIREARVGEVQAKIDGPNLARTQVRVTVVPEATGLPHLSWWRIDWRRGTDGTWRAFSIEPLVITGVPAAR
jgi:hypothetical protein